MARIPRIITFSAHFSVDPEHLRNSGAIDPILNFDSKYFIDPMRVPLSSVMEVRQTGTKLLEDYFKLILSLLKSSQREGDATWRQAERMLSCKEIRSIGLGYGASSTRGSSLSATTVKHMVRTAFEIVRAGISDPNLFMILPLFEENVGADTLSDMVAAAILPALTAFTQRVLAEYPELPTSEFHGLSDDGPVKLVAHPYQDGPVIFVPEDIVSALPIAASWDEIATVCDTNRDLRTKFNRLVARYFSDAEEEMSRKAIAAGVIQTQPELAGQILELLAELKASVAALPRNSPDGVAIGRLANETALQETSQSWHKPRSQEEALVVVKKIIADFKFLIEDRRQGALLFREDGMPRHEHFAQMLFFTVAYVRCKAFGLDVTPEADTGYGPVDFKFSCGFDVRVLVEVKLSTNSRAVHGVRTQLPLYANAEETQFGIFLFLDVGKLAKNGRK